LVLTDLRQPDHDGLVLLQHIRKSDAHLPFIVMTSYAEVQNAVCAMKSGATDYVAKPFHPEILLEKIREAIQSAASAVSTPQRAESAAMQDAPQEEQQGATEVPRYIKGESEASKQLYEFVSLVAPTPMSVLILGASGTGKEYVARSIHEQSLRKDKPFYAIDCGAIPKEVAASEFFGYKKGAFTGAEQDKKGAFEIANGGTVFLDEMGNLNYEVQVQLLRALQERKIRPLGSTQEIDVDIRLICATNENLAQAVAEGKFREDLYHRINEFTIYMPALKDRGADIFLFANLFIKHANQELGKNVLGLDVKASEIIASYDWPGNLRELNNVMKRATLLARGKYIGAQELEKTMAQTSTARPLNMQLHSEQSEQESIAAALRATHGNKSKAAQLLAIDRKTLYNKMKKYGME
ncbi:sigma-54-dependent Fis family transcriptional regulator, partial [Prevotella copri]|uniref:sigma-54-dependent transcriptional regulator n=1 Tax=Segatella copri TaxID=165179 RepID=UPI001290EBF3